MMMIRLLPVIASIDRKMFHPVQIMHRVTDGVGPMHDVTERINRTVSNNCGMPIFA